MAKTDTTNPAAAPVGHMSDRLPATGQQALDDGRYLLAHLSDPNEALGCKIQAALNVASFAGSLAFPMSHGPFGATLEQQIEVEGAVKQMMEQCPECCPKQSAGAAGFSWLTALTFLKLVLDMLTKQAQE